MFTSYLGTLSQNLIVALRPWVVTAVLPTFSLFLSAYLPPHGNRHQ
jgi:hypothetical protein